MSGLQEVGSNGAHVVDEFESWLSERNRWIQTAAKNLIETKRPPNDEEIAELARLCRIESSKGDDPGFGVVAPGSLALAANRPEIRIEGISDVHGLNAVKAGADLPFSTGNVTVFYGQNGSGKSGYARLLKQACGSKSKDEIHPNVFVAESPPCRAKFHLSVGGKAGVIDWAIDAGAHSKLQHAQIFDSKTATLYMGKNEASYEPSQMKFVAALISISDRVGQTLTAAKNALVSSLPQFPLEIGATDEKRWLDAIRASSTKPAIEKACLYTQENDVRIPRPLGHPFHEHPDSDSRLIRTLIPESSGH